MSTSCNTTECQLKFVEYKNSIDKLLKRLRDSEQQKGEYEIYNLTLKHKLKRPAKTESKHFEKLFEYIDTLIHNYFGKKKNSKILIIYQLISIFFYNRKRRN